MLIDAFIAYVKIEFINIRYNNIIMYSIVNYQDCHRIGYEAKSKFIDFCRNNNIELRSYDGSSTDEHMIGSINPFIVSVWYSILNAPQACNYIMSISHPYKLDIHDDPLIIRTYDGYFEIRSDISILFHEKI